MHIDEDTSAWLGCPTPLEMYKHQCSLLEDELSETQALLRKARKNIAGLVQMNDALATGKAEAQAVLKKALAEIGELKERCSEPAILGMKLVAEQRDYLLRENQRILLELSVLSGPQP
ncbi:hypothetical protein [Pseudomonas fluorescens]|uniref:Uncharacterized protein n=2 Tax=Pseudomonas fluorescens TaxID=294 RepID=A0ABY1TJL1_PSEFL|nr:hypothetical protein [Pseudomonas fluorescens]MCI4607204.1 hypothetical protein [Pseudomonas fluorescens]PQA99870.1 hypothetical protein B0A76_16115 [Pseudomonas fluorescens]RFP96072.1 hypothetical protein D0N73_10705 [Pseudomonas fluorescens]TWR44671.1 hypothetical protein FIP59_23715 [Pseudomonas fluorescens]UKJ66665.1 hypothetical protein H1Q68_17130 [Pseudomonas fluorescens]